MSNTTKALSKEARIAAIKANNKKYGLTEGLFLLSHVARHQDKVINGRTLASFGFNVKPLKANTPSEAKKFDQDFKPGQFTWVNQLIDVEKGAKVVEAMTNLMDQLKATGKPVGASITYKINKKGYKNVNSLYERNLTKTAPKSQSYNSAANSAASQATQAPAASDETVPF